MMRGVMDFNIATTMVLPQLWHSNEELVLKRNKLEMELLKYNNLQKNWRYLALPKMILKIILTIILLKLMTNIKNTSK